MQDHYTPTEREAIRIGVIVSGSLTLLGALAQLGTYALTPSLRSSSGPLVILIWLALCDGTTGIASILSGAFPATDMTGNPPMCTAQALLLQSSNLAAVGWTLAVVHNLYRVVCTVDLNYSRAFKWYHLCIWTGAGALGVAPLIAGVYGPAGDWCWIPGRHPYWRLSFYVPLVVSGPVMVGFLIAGRAAINKSQGLMPRSLTAARKSKLYARVVILIIIFMFSWSAAIVNRVLEIFGHHIFALAFLQGVCDPLQGALNAIVFFAIPKVRQALGCMQPTQAPLLSINAPRGRSARPTLAAPARPANDYGSTLSLHSPSSSGYYSLPVRFVNR